MTCYVHSLSDTFPNTPPWILIILNYNGECVHPPCLSQRITSGDSVRIRSMNSQVTLQVSRRENTSTGCRAVLNIKKRRLFCLMRLLSSGEIGGFPHTIATTMFSRHRATHVRYARIHFGPGAQQPLSRGFVWSSHYPVSLSRTLL